MKLVPCLIAVVATVHSNARCSSVKSDSAEPDGTDEKGELPSTLYYSTLINLTTDSFPEIPGSNKGVQFTVAALMKNLSA